MYISFAYSYSWYLFIYYKQVTQPTNFSKEFLKFPQWHSAVLYMVPWYPFFLKRWITVLSRVFPVWLLFSGIQLWDLRGARCGGRQTDQPHRFAQTTVRQVHGRLGLLGSVPTTTMGVTSTPLVMWNVAENQQNITGNGEVWKKYEEMFVLFVKTTTCKFTTQTK